MIQNTSLYALAFMLVSGVSGVSDSMKVMVGYIHEVEREHDMDLLSLLDTQPLHILAQGRDNPRLVGTLVFWKMQMMTQTGFDRLL